MSAEHGRRRNQPGEWARVRGRHRLRSHHDAHDAARDEMPPPVLEHPLVPAGEPALIADAAELQALLADLRAAGRFGYDSEFIGEQSYHPLLCVIQVATCDRVTLIDPLSGLDLTGFWELLADPAVEKVVHSGVQDLEPVPRHLDIPPANIFDVQIASGFTGQPYPSALNRLAQELIGADLGRGLKFSQWDHRPLSAVQMQYAANDVRYLPALREALGERLEAMGNTAWALEECAALTDPELYRFDPRSQRVRARGVRQLGPRRLAALRALLEWREEAAREADVPARALLGDEVLVSLARATLQSDRDLSRIRGLPRPVRARWAETIIRTIAEARARPLPSTAPAPEPPPFGRRPEERQRLESLWKKITDCCTGRSIDRGIAVSKREIERLLAGRPVARLTRGWRRELLGDLLDEATRGHSGG